MKAEREEIGEGAVREKGASGAVVGGGAGGGGSRGREGERRGYRESVCLFIVKCIFGKVNQLSYRHCY